MIPIEDFKAYKRSLQRKHNTTAEDAENTGLQARLLRSESSVSVDSLNSDGEDGEVEEIIEDKGGNPDDEFVCAICLEEFDTDCQVVVLPCKSHTFHGPCIEKWLKVNSVCPECRFQVTKGNL